MEKFTVFYESWQMKCCGIPFAKGDIVKWLVCKSNLLYIAVDIEKIDYCYNAHSSEWTNLFVLEGKVEEIKILYEKFMPSDDNPNLLVPVSGKMIKAESVEGFEKDLDGMQVSGYIVLLNECAIRPAKKEEVTYK